MTESEQELSELFERYRHACPDVEAGPDFMPRLWARIDSRRSFPLVFQKFGRLLVTASAAACLALAALNLLPVQLTKSGHYASYIDALSADTTLERTYYTAHAETPASYTVDDEKE